MRAASLFLFLLVGLSGCVYSFTGGGLPRHIRTMAVLPFDVSTTPVQPLLSSDVQTALQDGLPRNLGVRLVDETVADAVVRGQITGFQDVPQNILPADGAQDARVVQNEVRIIFQAEIYDAREDRVIWQASSLSGVGAYRLDGEDPTVGRELAVADMVRKIVDGAQSQW